MHTYSCDLNNPLEVSSSLPEGLADAGSSGGNVLVVTELAATYVNDRPAIFSLFPGASFLCYELMPTGMYGVNYLSSFLALIPTLTPWTDRLDVISTFPGPCEFLDVEEKLVPKEAFDEYPDYALYQSQYVFVRSSPLPFEFEIKRVNLEEEKDIITQCEKMYVSHYTSLSQKHPEVRRMIKNATKKGVFFNLKAYVAKASGGVIGGRGSGSREAERAGRKARLGYTDGHRLYVVRGVLMTTPLSFLTLSIQPPV